MSRSPWARPYRPLRPASLILQLAVLTAAEIALFQSYGSFDSSFHWGAHFLVGLLTTALLLTAYLLVAATPAPAQVLSLLAMHLYAMTPDLLFRVGVPHSPWMNVFLGHIAVHYIPGGDRTWLALAGTATLGYLVLLARWVSARRAEAASGLPPGIGIGGSAVWRPQVDARSTPLAHRHDGPPQTPAVVLLHGLGATSAVWEPVAAELARRGVASLSPDLLGYGDSLRIGTRFTPSDQADALLALLDHHGLAQAVLVAHSYGCLVAATVAQHAPERLAALVLVTPPLFVDADRAKQRIGSRSWLARKTLEGAGAANVACGLMCLLRKPLGTLAPHAHGGLPDDLDEQVASDVARGSMAHNYPSYRDGLLAMFDANTLPALLKAPPVPTTVVLASSDRTAPADDILDLEIAPGVNVQRRPGTHLILLTDPMVLADIVAPLGAGPSTVPAG